MGHRVCIAALAAAAMLPMAGAAAAKEVRYPAASPRISLKVPDDWAVAETPLGLELQSPQKDALVLAGLTAGDRGSVDAWSRRALERMSGEGVVFAKTGSAQPADARYARPAAPRADAAKPDAAKPAEATGHSSTPADLAHLNGDHPYTFDGAPTIETPKIGSETSAPIVGRVGDLDLPSISTEGVNPGGMKPSGHYAYTGGNLRGQPVDVELAVFPMGKNKRLLIEQQSGPTDARGVMIVRSLRSLDAAE